MTTVGQEEETEIEVEITEEDFESVSSAKTPEPDWLSEVHRQMSEMSDVIANEKLIPLYLACDGLSVHMLDPSVDPEAADLMQRNELRYVAHKAFEGYVVLLASDMFRANRYEPFRVHIPSAEALQGVADYYEVPVPIIRFVIACANELPRLPMVGDIAGGTLVPDVLSIKRWAEHFDWSE